MSQFWHNMHREPSRKQIYRTRVALALAGVVVGVAFLFLTGGHVVILSLMLMLMAGLCQSVAELLPTHETRLAGVLRLASLPLMVSALVLLAVAVFATLHSGHAFLTVGRAFIIVLVIVVAMAWLSRGSRWRE